MVVLRFRESETTTIFIALNYHHEKDPISIFIVHS